MNNKKKTGRILLPILMCVCLAVMAVSAYKLITISLEYRQGEKEYDILQSYTTEQNRESADQEPKTESDGSEGGETQPEEKEEAAPITVDFDNLKKINLDICGWLYIPVLDLSYPIVQGTDNEQYLHRTFEGTDNFAGSLFVDAGVKHPFEDCHTIIYGHNMKNMSMFGKLKLLPKNELYRQEPVFWIITPEKARKYQIFHIGYTDATSNVYTLFSAPDEAFVEYVRNIQENTTVSQEGVPEADEKCRIVTLSTCVAAEGMERLIVQGIIRE